MWIGGMFGTTLGLTLMGSSLTATEVLTDTGARWALTRGAVATGIGSALLYAYALSSSIAHGASHVYLLAIGCMSCQLLAAAIVTCFRHRPAPVPLNREIGRRPMSTTRGRTRLSSVASDSANIPTRRDRRHSRR